MTGASACVKQQVTVNEDVVVCVLSHYANEILFNFAVHF